MHFFPTLFFHIYMFFTLLLYVVLDSFPVWGSNRGPLGGCRVFFILLAYSRIRAVLSSTITPSGTQL